MRILGLRLTLGGENHARIRYLVVLALTIVVKPQNVEGSDDEMTS